jgi:hypothetical protein
VLPLLGRPEDLLIAKSGARQADRNVSNLPSAEVGSILEYCSQIRYRMNFQ